MLVSAVGPRPALLTALTLAAGVGLTSTSASGQQPAEAFVGTWEGTLDAGAAQLRLVLHVTLDDDGSLSGTLDSPDQGAEGIVATTVEVGDDGLRFAVESLGASYEGTLNQEGALEGTFRQGPAELPLVLQKVEKASAPDRPQNPEPPFPYYVEEVSFPGGAEGVTLAGTLTLPPGNGPFPAAVLVSGSGPQDRDETLLGHKPFLVLADHLTRSGIAVLRYDDRGFGASTGQFAAATSEDFTDDAVAAAEWMTNRTDVSTVGIVGHSEGGLVGPLAAVQSARIGFVVMLAGPGVSGADILLSQARLINRAAGTPEETVEMNARVQARLFQIVKSEPDPTKAAPLLRAAIEEGIASLPDELREAMAEQASPQAILNQVAQVNSPWFRYFLTYDPAPTLERVRVPVLALNGANDLQVPAEENLAAVAAALARGGNPDVTVTNLPGLNHLFQESSTGAPSEYARISQTMSPLVLETVAEWILERFGPGR